MLLVYICIYTYTYVYLYQILYIHPSTHPFVHLISQALFPSLPCFGGKKKLVLDDPTVDKQWSMSVQK